MLLVVVTVMVVSLTTRGIAGSLEGTTWSEIRSAFLWRKSTRPARALSELFDVCKDARLFLSAWGTILV